MVHNPMMRWLLAHSRALRIACAALVRAPITNFFTIAVIAIAITLPLCLFVTLQNLQKVDSAWEISTPSISLYLTASATEDETNDLLKTLKTNPNIKKVTYISPAEGLTEFEKSTRFTNLEKLFQHNPIPATVVIYLNYSHRTPEAVRTLFDQLKTAPIVDEGQLDINWVTRLYDIILIGEKLTKVLSLLFAAGIVLIIGHTLRAQLAHHLKEIQVLRLLGATNGFIRRPLLYRGTMYGLLGGAIAWTAITGLIFVLQSPVSRLAETYQATFTLSSLSWVSGVAMLVICGLLGFCGAFLITGEFLNLPEQVS
jgi:cell division transport system permease protein